MSQNVPGEFTSDPGLSALLGALTAEPAPAELAGEQAALSMFRAHRGKAPPDAGPQAWKQAGLPDASWPSDARPARRRPQRSRPGSTRSLARRLRLGMAAAAAAAIVGSVSAAYAAALPPPVQRFAHEVLGFVGVPDSRQAAQSATAPIGPSSRRPAHHHSASAAAGRPSSTPASSRPRSSPKRSAAKPSASARPHPSPSASSSPSAAATEQVSIGAAQGQIAAGSTAVLIAEVTQGGKPVAGVAVTLRERTGRRTGWRPAGSGVTSAAGKVEVDVSDLATNAAFRFTGTGGRTSSKVIVTVVPAVTLQLQAGPGGRRDALVVSSPFAQPRNYVLLQLNSGNGWVTIRERRIGIGRSRTFLVRARRLDGHTVRAVLPGTRRHAPGVSNLVTVPG